MKRKLKPIDSIALKYITAQAKLNAMTKLNSKLLERIDVLIEMNKNQRAFNKQTY